MKILRYWKRVEMPGLPGITFDIVPMQEITSEQGCFEAIVKAVRAADYLDFTLIQQTETVDDYRHS